MAPRPGGPDRAWHDLATNAIIERKGARTALVTTKGFRDSIEMAQENRFEQYDIFIEKPEPLVPRTLRFTVPERTDAKGACGWRSTRRRSGELAATLKARAIEAVAVSFLHSYANPRTNDAPPRSCRRRCRRAHLAVQRGLPGGARVRALLDDLRQRLGAAADGALPRRT